MSSAELILQPFRHFTYVTAHSPTLPSLYLSHNSFSNPSVALPTSQRFLQSLRCFTYVTVHSPTLLSLLLRHKLFTWFTWRAAHVIAELILQPFRHFTYVTTHSPSLPSLYLRHSSFSKPSVTSPTSQLILQPFRCITYVTVRSPTLLSLLLRHKLFTWFTWRAAHALGFPDISCFFQRDRPALFTLQEICPWPT